MGDLQPEHSLSAATTERMHGCKSLHEVVQHTMHASPASSPERGALTQVHCKRHTTEESITRNRSRDVRTSAERSQHAAEEKCRRTRPARKNYGSELQPAQGPVPHTDEGSNMDVELHSLLSEDSGRMSTSSSPVRAPRRKVGAVLSTSPITKRSPLRAYTKSPQISLRKAFCFLDTASSPGNALAQMKAFKHEDSMVSPSMVKLGASSLRQRRSPSLATATPSKEILLHGTEGFEGLSPDAKSSPGSRTHIPRQDGFYNDPHKSRNASPNLTKANQAANDKKSVIENNAETLTSEIALAIRMNKQPPYKRSSSWEAEIPKSYLSNFIATHALSTCFLILMGAAMGLISFVLQTCISCLVKISLMATSTSPSTAIDLVAYSAVFVSYAMISGVVTKLFAPGAVGSGISVMKYLLGADAGEADNYLTFPTWITKIIGLIFAVASGLSIGREGPNVWIASATAHLMLRYIPWFQSLSKSAALNRQIYAAACACTRVHGFVSRLTLDVMKVGVSTTFAAPIGGVLFSIEVTSTYYLLANYWKAFLAALSGATVSRLLLLTQESEAIAQGNFLQDAQVDARWHFFELPIFILLGALLGFLGSVYLSVQIFIKRHMGRWNKKWPILVIVVVSLINAVVLFYAGPIQRQQITSILNTLLAPDALIGVQWYPIHMPLVASLVATLGTRVILTWFDTPLALPAGDFIPVFVIGALFGHIFVIILQAIVPSRSFSATGYALLSGAAFAGGITQTISSAVIAIEIANVSTFHLPLLLAVMSAYAVARICGLGLYDRMIQLQGLPSLPLLTGDARLRMFARDLMESQLVYLKVNSTLKDIVHVMATSSFSVYPVVDSEESRLFMGCVSRYHLREYVFVSVYECQREERLPELLPRDLDTLDSIRGRKIERRRPIPFGWRMLYQQEHPNPDQLHMPDAVVHELELKVVNLQNNDEIPLDTSAFRVPETMGAEQVYILFEMLRCTRVFVTSTTGVLTGVISRKILIQNFQRVPGSPLLQSPAQQPAESSRPDIVPNEEVPASPTPDSNIAFPAKWSSIANIQDPTVTIRMVRKQSSFRISRPPNFRQVALQVSSPEDSNRENHQRRDSEVQV